jgi:hypothetical protein
MGFHLRNRISVAHVLALVAMFVALGGTSYAVTQLPKGSVGSKQLKKNAVTSKKVKDGSLLARDFRAGQLASAGAPGPAGPQGPVGPQGPAGVADFRVAYGEIIYSSSGGENVKEETVDCPGDARPVGAGFDGPVYTQSANGVAVPGWWVPAQGPVEAGGTYAGNGDTATGWRVKVDREAAASMTIRIRVVCAEVG